MIHGKSEGSLSLDHFFFLPLTSLLAHGPAFQTELLSFQFILQMTVGENIRGLARHEIGRSERQVVQLVFTGDDGDGDDTDRVAQEKQGSVTGNWNW